MYIDVIEANAYFADRLHSEAWDEATETDKAKALATASKRLDLLHYRGRPVNPDQGAAFPRLVQNQFGYMVDIGIPQAVKDAVCEEALSLLAQSDFDRVRADLRAKGVVSVRAGDASETYSEDMVKQPQILTSAVARQLLSPFIEKAAWLV